MKVIESVIRKNPATFEFLPSISRTSMYPYVIWIFSFGTYSFEVTILKQDEEDSNINNNAQYGIG